LITFVAFAPLDFLHDNRTFHPALVANARSGDSTARLTISTPIFSSSSLQLERFDSGHAAQQSHTTARHDPSSTAARVA
jgi:hypothetical protein